MYASGVNHPKWKGGPPKCLECGKQLSKKHYEAKWCSQHKGLHLRGNSNYAWKGEAVSYRNLHRWVERTAGKPNTCVMCKQSHLKGKSIHWANRSGQYKRDLNDWIRLCVPCHANYDKNRGINQ